MSPRSTSWRERLRSLWAARVRRLVDRVPAPRVSRRPVRVVDEQAIVHDDPSLRARVIGRATRLVFKPLLRLTPVSDRSLAAMRRLDALSARRPHSRHVDAVPGVVGGVRAETMTPRAGRTSDLTLLYLHGGGFFSGSIDTHRRVCERLTLATGGTVVTLDYMQLPEGTVADSVQDAIGAYAALTESVPHPDRIAVAGDSAGGYLAMKVAELASRRGLPAPAAVIGFSPLLSLDPDNVDKGVQRVRRPRDAYLPLRRVAIVRRRWVPEGATPIEGCESPLDAVEHLSSPTFLTAADDEILRPEVEAMALLLGERGVTVRTHLWRGQVHAFPVIADPLPEALEAIGLAAAFAREAVGDPLPSPEPVGATHEETMIGEIEPDS